MTIIEVAFTRPSADGTRVPTTGALTWTPTRHRIIEGEPDTVVLPLPFRVPVPAEGAQVTVEPTGPGWVWSVVESIPGLHPRKRYFPVPDAVTVDYADLVPVDIRSMAPSAVPEPAWYNYVNDLALGAEQAKVAAAAAQLAAETAIAGAAGAIGTEFTFTAPSATWILAIPAEFTRRPTVNIYDVNGELVEADVIVGPAIVTITFYTPFAGSAVLN